MSTLTGIWLPASTAGSAIVADGTSWQSRAVSGDASLSAAGALTLAAGAVTNPKLAAMVRGSIKAGSVAGAASDLPVGTAGQVLLSNGTDSVWTTLSGGVTNVSSTGTVTLNTDTQPWTVVNRTTDYTLLAADVGTLFT